MLLFAGTATAHHTPKRDSVKWPAAPVTLHDLKVRGIQWRRFVNLARCEAGPGRGAYGVRWNTPPSYTWQGGLGIYNRTHRSVNHPYGSDLGAVRWETQVLVGEHVRRTYGITAWSASGCF